MFKAVPGPLAIALSIGASPTPTYAANKKQQASYGENFKRKPNNM
jgi:hypothetical protein